MTCRSQYHACFSSETTRVCFTKNTKVRLLLSLVNRNVMGLAVMASLIKIATETAVTQLFGCTYKASQHQPPQQGQYISSSTYPWWSGCGYAGYSRNPSHLQHFPAPPGGFQSIPRPDRRRCTMSPAVGLLQGLLPVGHAQRRDQTRGHLKDLSQLLLAWKSSGATPSSLQL